MKGATRGWWLVNEWAAKLCSGRLDFDSRTEIHATGGRVNYHCPALSLLALEGKKRMVDTRLQWEWHDGDDGESSLGMIRKAAGRSEVAAPATWNYTQRGSGGILDRGTNLRWSISERNE
jgi:hypothetical protein